MMAIPFLINEHEYSVFIVLGTDNLERMKGNDPAVVDFRRLLAKTDDRMRAATLRDVIMVTPTLEDLNLALKKYESEGPSACFKHLTRGYHETPLDGGEYQSLEEVRKSAN